MNMKKILVVAIRTIFILFVLTWLGMIIDSAFDVDSVKITFRKQLILLLGGPVIAIVSIVTFRGKEK